VSDKTRIIELQRQIRIAKRALERLKAGGCPIAGDALYEMMPLDRKQPLQGLVGHERNRP
jgi:Mg-chelatase subunit ChlD